jgi:cbb3-type cytochrome oxidase cytochrome c subunit
MAASDQTYRKQKLLDIIFAVSGILMLLSIVGMFAQDYFREFKVEQRRFRDVEAAMAERSLLDVLPRSQLEALDAAEKAVPKEDAGALAEARKKYYEARKQLLDAEDKLTQARLQAQLRRERSGGAGHGDPAVDQAEAAAKDARQKRDAVIDEAPESVKTVLQAEEALLGYLDRFRLAEKAVQDAKVAVKEQEQNGAEAIRQAQVARARADADYRSIKAKYDSLESLYNIAVDERDRAPEARKEALTREVEQMRTKELDPRRKKRDDAKIELDARTDDLHKAETAKADAEKLQTQAEADLKKLRSDYDRYQKLVEQKRWKATDWLLSQPVIDAFHSPIRIDQITLTEYPIDYSFKYVTRFDRCRTCHQGMETAAYEKPALHALVSPPKQLQADLSKFRTIIEQRQKRGEGTGGFDLNDLPSQAMTLPAGQLTDARVTEFCAHPRLDLFVDSNSPHPVEKFGCTSCHAGQGSATDFAYAAHTPDSPAQKQQWEDDHGWFPSHFWDFPMYPKRFQEATCLKCHHQVTDLVRYGNQVEAPKLVKGFNLIRENGCFGCHEIAGMKRGREIGPDLRLEPAVPLSKMDPAERAKLEADTANPPGTMRKVGPSLFRLAEKTNEDWVTRWVWSPRGFRPTTKMPHFYGLSNNHPDVLAKADDQATRDQKDFPSAEVEAIAHYLVHESRNYLDGNDPYRRVNQGIVKYYQDMEKKQGALGESDRKELKAARERLDAVATGTSVEVPLELLRLQPGQKPRPLAEQGKVLDGEGNEVTLPADKKERDRGRRLFSEKGCLACHQHEGTTKPGADVPAVVSAADFGPDLSHVAAKLGDGKGNEAARRWLVQWILNPQVHHPRTRMPYTHLTAEEASAVADWLLSEGRDWKGDEPPPLDNPLATYKALARLYLSKVRNPKEVEDLLKHDDPQAQDRAHLWLDGIRPDSDEAILQGGVNEDTLKLYVGRKAISRYGCFGCHNVPGFETAKPIGTPLNDWGKKDPERLAFEDIVAYVHDHHSVVEHRDDPKDPTKPSKEWGEVKDGKTPYEEFFFEELQHQQRDGFLNQKLSEPRSYDYHRGRVWDDRLRMPQFKFAHVRRLEDESDEDYDARARKEEAEAREAVMTFVLGLVAEPVPAEYLPRPGPDRQAEVKGRELVEYFNCVGCHEVRPGVYEFKSTPEALKRLEDSYATVAGTFAGDFGAGKDPVHAFVMHNAWQGPAPPWPDRLLAYGVDYRKAQGDEGEVPVIRLTEAFRFVNQDKQERDLPANSALQLPDESNLLTRAGPLGGAFARLMTGYLMKRDSVTFKDVDTARSALPPQLFREGERTQPEWLFGFIRNPGVIRPPEYMLLRMPKFNISDEDARALANYFNAVDRAGNTGIGLTYPYMSVPERQEEYWRRQTQEYKKRLGADKVNKRAAQLEPLWLQALKDRLTEADRKLSAAEDQVKDAKDADVKKTAEQNRDALKKEVEALKQQVDNKDVSGLRKEWEESGVYLADGYRLLTNSASPCLGCHAVGDVRPKETKGPNLELAFERLRPGWTERWLANPPRLMQPTIMPQNFPRNEKNYTEIFDGSSLDQATAVRDVLMNFPKVANRPENRYSRSGSGGGG